MSDNSTIEWTDATWNPVTGCTEVTPGCDNCYAKTFANRWRGTPGHYFEHGFDVQLRPDKLGLPLRWRKPRRVFVNSMSDLFHKDVPDDYIARVFAVMAATPQHTYQLLTKRHGRMRALLNDECRCGAGHQPGVHLRSAIEWAATPHSPTYVPGLKPGLYHRMQWPLPNLWLGVSVEDQQRAELRIPALLDTPAAVRWLSCEPLLGPVDIFRNTNLDRAPGLDWVVVGGESGLTSRPMQPAWARSLRDECVGAGVPFFFKQWGGRTPKANGRELDGRTWDEYPAGDR
jgi:protein gp37